MSIGSSIGTILPSGLLQVIFIERGGSPLQLGAILKNRLCEQIKVEALLNLGDVQEIVTSVPQGLELGDSNGASDYDIPQLHFYEDLELWLTDAKRSSYAYLFENNQWKTYKKNWSPRGPLTPQGMPPKEMFICHWVDENENRVTKNFEQALYPIKVTDSVGNLPSDVEF